MRFLFISGLPRSGSTLLSALLRQNPRITAGVTSPVYGMLKALQRSMANTEYAPFLTEERRREVLRSVVNGYYKEQIEAANDSIIIDTNRAWTSRLPLLKSLYPDSAVICCVRDPLWIIDSIERMLDRNPLYTSAIFRNLPAENIYERAKLLMNHDAGLVGFPLNSLKEAFFGPFSRQLILINYDNLASKPESTIASLYEELGEPCWNHVFDKVEYQENEFDDVLAMPGMHTVRPVVAGTGRTLRLPPDLQTEFAGLDFWRSRDTSVDGSLIL